MPATTTGRSAASPGATSAGAAACTPAPSTTPSSRGGVTSGGSAPATAARSSSRARCRLRFLQIGGRYQVQDRAVVAKGCTVKPNGVDRQTKKMKEKEKRTTAILLYVKTACCCVPQTKWTLMLGYARTHQSLTILRYFVEPIKKNQYTPHRRTRRAPCPHRRCWLSWSKRERELLHRRRPDRRAWIAAPVSAWAASRWVALQSRQARQGRPPRRGHLGLRRDHPGPPWDDKIPRKYDSEKKISCWGEGKKKELLRGVLLYMMVSI